MRLADRVQRIKPSATIAAATKARQLRAQGVDIIDFTVGEPDLDTPDFIKSAAVEALQNGFTKYTDPRGMLPLREAICHKLARDNGLTYNPDEIVVSCGAKQALYNAFQALINPGDQVLIFSPYWVSYPDMVLLCDGEPVFARTEPKMGFKPDPDQLRNLLSSRVKVLLINSPCNPTGSVWDRPLLEKVAEIVVSWRDLIVISDEVYESLVYDGKEFASIASIAPEVKERTVVVNALSKTFSMTGWRLGYAAAPKPIADAMAKVQSQSTTNPTSFVQQAAIRALLEPGFFPQEMRKLYQKRRDQMVNGLNNLDGVHCPRPEGAFYAFADFRCALQEMGLSDDIELMDHLLTKGRVATVAGSAFGAPGWLRLSFAVREELIAEGLTRLQNSLGS
ncbi:MAG: pyridoxal phosphate-dependent aminotransferase [Armatimonadetes bacterium]|nr:pyridoxal phosphate-dependent aminotransferase [Armatimonadota bacterium]MDW8121495.1 pyridoxal phosphate-dependent aminotransferase [Armatimonadota bacterium]